LYIGIDYNYMASCMTLTALFEEKYYPFNMVIKGLLSVNNLVKSQKSDFLRECLVFGV